jgi:hypothetical protein
VTGAAKPSAPLPLGFAMDRPTNHEGVLIAEWRHL